jgi:ATP-dependent helicase/nuclease subunit A
VRVSEGRLRVPNHLPLRALMGAPPTGPIAGLTLTDEQEQPVSRRSEPLLLSAAAGSGKTSVLVERFVRAIREDGIAPAKILAITFTDRAAGELRERVRERLLSLGEREAARDAEAASVGTFHGFCARLLRSHPLPAGLDPEFTILDEGLAGRLRERALKSAMHAFLKEERTDAVDLVAAYGVDRVQSTIEGVHARLRSRGQRLPRLPVVLLDPGAEEVARDAAGACVLLDELLAGFTAAYEDLKGDRRAVDFDDLELRARDLLEDTESVRTAWSERFELLMVDEFQDTNPRQLGILEALDRGNLMTVGDEFQSIYGFRHAEVGLFRDRRAALAELGGSLALRGNFRSVPALLEVVNAVFSDRFAGFSRLHATRPTEQCSAPLVELLLTARSGWEEDEELASEIAHELPPAALWRQAEARLLAQRVDELVQSGSVRAGDVAVLLRAGGDLEVYERALQLRGMRTLAAAGGFWAHQQIGDLLAYLRALANPLDEQALYGTLASPLLGLSRDGLALLSRAAGQAGRGVWEAISRPQQEGFLDELAERDRGAVRAFCTRLQSERVRASERTLSELIERAIDHSGYREHVLGLEWGERRLANVHKLLRLARGFEASEGRDLRGFLDHATRLQETTGARESDAPVEGVEPDAVRLMSIHAAKGLEFPVVCVADLGRAPNVRQPDVLVDGERLGLALLRLDGEKAVPALDYEQLVEERRRAESEEEDRILYVAMTRARERLLLSGAVEFERWPEQRQGGTMISWLGPALGDVAALASCASPAVHDLAVGATHVRLRLSSPASAGDVLDRGSMSVGAPLVPSYLRGAGNLAPASPHTTQTRPFPVTAPGAGGISTWSYTTLSELERCGYRYYLERELGMSEARRVIRQASAGATLEARARGTLVHRLLETLDFHSPRPPSPEEVAVNARELGIPTSASEREEIARLIGGALAAAPASRLGTAVRVRRESPFAFALHSEEPGAPLITGVIDLLADESDGACLLIDYKSDRVSGEADLDALVEREYGVQRLIYALAVLRDGAPRVEIVHWFLERPQDWVSARHTAADQSELEERLAARIQSSRARGFAVSEHPHRGLCETCPGRGGLCSWSDAETLRETPAG